MYNRQKFNNVSHFVNDRKPQECTNLAEVRNEIDLIDREIIRLLSTRTQYVHEVVKYKENNVESIEAADRKREVLQTRRAWASERGISPDLVEELYTRIVSYYIEEEKKLKKL